MVESHSTPSRTRPGIVTLSGYLLMIFAFLQLVGLVATIAVSGRLRQGFEDAFEGTSSGAEGLGTFVVGFAIGSAVLMLVLALVLVVLAIFNNRGSNGSRITTWVLGGIMLCCIGGSLINGAAGSVGGPSAGGDAPSAEEIERSLSGALPSWYTPVSMLLGVVGLLAVLAALILLALPKANEFFRKPKQGWEPPVPGAAYPAYPQNPGYPQTPGYPAAPGQPGYPYGQPGHPTYPHGTSGSSAPDQPPYPDQPGPSASGRPDPSGPGQWGDPGPSSSGGGGDSGGSSSGGDSGSSSGGSSSSD
ncbi:hypothetical protein MCAG_03007 [Micromonospora sp. ATCC 39149]|uniref:Uncharacterized protein n=1 Tax=Micromonospora carbonacea TaxID=47853 RepID=A0A7D6C606_9ACTN|nr:hypothetical protein [Micromonospora sp. ATCC 39149]EEP72680.1 hypothetical protein MCAG_03007 [Micromonospora sp. ATCC 39149]QLJ98784.1 hypothetical protein HZU44_00690 [Micromonospora carbonacea]